MKQWKVVVTLAIFATLVLFWSGAPVNAQTLEFYQLDFNLDGTITENSDWGVVDLTFTGSPDILYFNLTVDGSWQAQNVPLFSIEGVAVSQTQSFWFDLGNEVGEDVSSLYYAYELTPDTLGSAPGGSTYASVADRWIVFYNGIEDDPGDPVPPPAVPMVGGMVGGNMWCWNRGVPNQEQGINECAPAAASNSLQWLNTVHGLGMPANTIDIATMKVACGWGPGGCPMDWGTRKGNYLRANGYPVTTRVLPANQIGQICAEINRNQDVEMTVTGHAVTVVGMVQLANGKWLIVFKDDKKQGQTTGLRTGVSIYDPTQGKITGGDLKGRTLHHFVVECPTCRDEIHKDTPDTAIDLHVLYAGTGGTLRGVSVISTPPGCGNPYINVVNGNQINFRWTTPCFDYGETIEYEFTVDYPCEQVFITDIEWTYDGNNYPTLSQWILILLALSVGAFFVWQLMRRRKAAASV